MQRFRNGQRHEYDQTVCVENAGEIQERAEPGREQGCEKTAGVEPDRGARLSSFV